MKDENIKKAAEMLLQGAKMLNLSCPECNNPIYELKDASLICIECDRPVKRNTSDITKEGHEKVSFDLELNDPISKKIQLLGRELLEERDHEKIRNIAKLISDLKKLIS